MTNKCDYCVFRNNLECKKFPAPKDLICDDFMLDVCTLSNKQQIDIQKMLMKENNNADPCEEVTKPEDPWYYTLGTRITMRDMNGEWHNGVVCSGYRFKDGIVTMERDDGLGKLWCGEEGENIWFRKAVDHEKNDRTYYCV